MSDIPDAISPEQLRSLLKGSNAPISDVIPALNFGTSFGGPCDLQYVVSQVIAKSAKGVNLIQLLMCALHLLTEAETHFATKAEQLLSNSGGFGDLEPREREGIARVTERHQAFIRSCVMALEQVLETYAPMSSALRVNELIARGDVKPQSKIDIRDLRSLLLFSDELLESLKLDRQLVTNYLNSTDTTQS